MKYAQLQDGTTLEFPDDTNDDVIDNVVKKHLGLSDKSLAMSFFGGVAKTALGAGKTLGIADKETYDKFSEAYDPYEKANPIMSGLGKGAPALAGAIPGLIVGGPLGLTAAAVGSGLIGGSGREAEVINQQEQTKQPVNLDTARTAGLSEAAFTGVGVALPGGVGAGLLKKLITGGAGNIALNELDIATQNQILKEYPQLQGANFDPKTMTVSGLFGLLGGAMQHIATPKEKLPQNKPNVENKPNANIANELDSRFTKENLDKTVEKLDAHEANALKKDLIDIDKAINETTDNVEKAKLMVARNEIEQRLDSISRRTDAREQESLNKVNDELASAERTIDPRIRDEGETSSTIRYNRGEPEESTIIKHNREIPESTIIRHNRETPEDTITLQPLEEEKPNLSPTKQAIYDVVRPLEQRVAKELGLEDLNYTKNQLETGLAKSIGDVLDDLAAAYGLRQGRDGDIPKVKTHDSGYIDVIEVPSKWQHQGIGESFVKQIEDNLRQKGRTTSWLMSEPTEKALSFWKKMGYERTDMTNTDGQIMHTKSLVNNPDDVPTMVPGKRIDPDVDVVKLANHIETSRGTNKPTKNLSIDKNLFVVDEKGTSYQQHIYKIITNFINRLGLGNDKVVIIADASIPAGRLTIKDNTFYIRINPSGIMKEFNSLLSDPIIRDKYNELSHTGQGVLRQTITIAHELGHAFFYKMAHHYWRSPAEVARLINLYTKFVRERPQWMKVTQYLFPEQFMGKGRYKTDIPGEDRIISFKEYFANQVAKELIYDNVKGRVKGEVLLGEQGSRLKELGQETTTFTEINKLQDTIDKLKEKANTLEKTTKSEEVWNTLEANNNNKPVYQTKATLEYLELWNKIRILEAKLNKAQTTTKTKVESEYMGQAKMLDSEFRKITSPIVRLAKGISDFIKDVFDSLAPDTRDINLRATKQLGGDLIRQIIAKNAELEELGKTIWQHLDERAIEKGLGLKKSTFELDRNLLSNIHNFSTEYGYNTATGTVRKLPITDPYDNAPLLSIADSLKAMTNKEDLPPISSRILLQLLGRRTNAGVRFDNPIVTAVNKILNDRTREATQIFNKLMHGDFVPGNLGPLRSLKAAVEEMAVSHIVKRAKADDLFAVFDLLKRNYDINAVEPKNILDLKQAGNYKGLLETIKQEYQNVKGLDTLTPLQRQYFDSLTNMWAKQHVEEVKTFHNMGKKETPPFHPNWYPAVRSGDYYFTLSYGGRIVHAQYFRTPELAKRVVDRFNALSNKRGLEISAIDKVEKTTDAENAHELVRLYGDYIGDASSADAFIQKLQIYGGKLGKHHEFRYNVDGYMGTELFLNKEEAGNSFRRAIEESVNERVSIMRKMMVTHDLSPIINDTNLQQTKPNTYNAVKMAYDMVQNKVPNRLEWFDDKAERGFEWLYLNGRRPFVKGLNKIGNLIDNKTLRNIDSEELPQISTLKKAMGTTSNLFYMFSLMARPSFWAGQLLTPTTTVPRVLLRETNVFDAMRSMGEGIHLILKGDPEFNKIAKYVRDTTDTFHPQFINDFNNLNFLDKLLGEKGRNGLDWFTGQAESTAADAWSRYYTFAACYAHNKKLGLKGQELVNKTIDMTGEASVLYGRAEKAPIFQHLGIVGDLVSPLQTFGQAQLGNLIADFRRAKITKDAAPFIATYITTMVMSGVMGTAGFAEVEVLARLLRKTFGYDVPTPLEWLMRGDLPSDRFMSHGALSEITQLPGGEGFDISSSLRNNPILMGILIGDKTMLESFPTISFASQTIGHLGTATKSVFTDVSNADRREAALGLTPGGYKAMTDITKFNALNRDMVPDKEGNAKIKQSGQKVVAQALGTKTIEEGVDRTRLYLDKQNQEEKKKRFSNYMNILTDAAQRKDNAKVQDIVNRLTRLGYTGDEIAEAYKAKVISRTVPEYQRTKYGTTGNISTQRARRIMDFEKLEGND